MAGTLIANTINTDTGVYTNLNALNGCAKAWVNFVGSTAVINGSFNVSSITRTGTGAYTINYANALSSANYALHFSSAYAGSGSGPIQQLVSLGTTSASVTVATTAVFIDPPICCISVIGA